MAEEHHDEYKEHGAGSDYYMKTLQINADGVLKKSSSLRTNIEWNNVEFDGHKKNVQYNIITRFTMEVRRIIFTKCIEA